jgi:hypothetical protein
MILSMIHVSLLQYHTYKAKDITFQIKHKSIFWKNKILYAWYCNLSIISS